jgi:putative DNA primase/helicase
VCGLDALARAPAIVIGEGYATAVTLSEALGFATVAAFDSGNLRAVAKALQGRFPDKPIVIAGDDDQHLIDTLGKNPGREKMEQAAAAVGAAKLLPVFAPGERDARPGVFTDFNDLATKSAVCRSSRDRQAGSGPCPRRTQARADPGTAPRLSSRW